MKKKSLSIIIALSMVTLTCVLAGCNGGDKKYFQNVAKYSFWNNKATEAIAQYKNYNIVKEFLDDGTIENGNVVKDGKVKKVAYIALDGVRSDALVNICNDKNDANTNDYNNESIYSGINTLRKTGGLYLAYSGGEKGKDSQQSSSTSASWTSQFTGGWNTLHGVKENDNVKSGNSDSFYLEYAKKGLNTSLAFDWGQLFDINLRPDVQYAYDNPTLPILFRDVDRAVANSVNDISGGLLASSLELHNFIAVDNVPEDAPYDSMMFRHFLERVEAGDDIVGGIFHNPDSNGHKDGFSNSNNNYVNSVRNCDEYAYNIIKVLEQRMADLNEDWLIIMTTDHGGDSKGNHGSQVYEHRTTWIASNKAIDSKYFGKGYDGYKEN